ALSQTSFPFIDKSTKTAPTSPAAPTIKWPEIAEIHYAEPGFGDADLDRLDQAARRLPGGGLSEFADKASYAIGRALPGHDRRGIYYVQICRSGRIEAADLRGTLQQHAMAISAELAWAQPQYRDRLNCELRPTGCHLVSVERLAGLARLLVGL